MTQGKLERLAYDVLGMLGATAPGQTFEDLKDFLECIYLEGKVDAAKEIADEQHPQ